MLEQEVDSSQIRLNTKCHRHPISIAYQLDLRKHLVDWSRNYKRPSFTKRTFARMEEEEAERHFIGFDFSTQQVRKMLLQQFELYSSVTINVFGSQLESSGTKIL